MSSRTEQAYAIMRGLQCKDHLKRRKEVTREQIDQLAEKVGVALVDQEGAHQYEQGIIFTHGLRKANELLHEIAHYQVSSPYRRQFPDYGLGNGNALAKEWVTMVNEKAAYREECEASLLGILHERQMGGPYHETIHWHSWALYRLGSPSQNDAFVWEDDDLARNTFLSLLRKKVVSARGVPRAVLSQEPDIEDLDFLEEFIAPDYEVSE